MTLLSPGIENKEISFQTSIARAGNAAGVTVGVSQWGPVFEPTTVSSEAEFANIFGLPKKSDPLIQGTFLEVANFLRYTGRLTYVRAVAADAYNASSDLDADVRIESDTDYETQYTTLTDAFVAKYIGSYGNRIAVAHIDKTTYDINPIQTIDGTDYNFGVLQNPLGTDEIGLIVYFDGLIQETHIVSTDVDATDLFGRSKYALDYFTRGESSLIYSTLAAESLVGTGVLQFSHGSEGDQTTVDAAMVLAWDMFLDKEAVTVDILFAGGACKLAETDYLNVIGAINQVANTRRDVVYTVSNKPSNLISGGLTTAQKTAEELRFRTATGINSDFSIFASNAKYVYDKYNGSYQWISTASDVAGLIAQTANLNEAWDSPAGFVRGRLIGGVKYAYNANATQRDDLYQNQINPVVSFGNSGTILYGDKTGTISQSAFDRINVRRLFNVLERAIGISARSRLFELNDDFTQTQFRNAVSKYLETIKGRRGIQDFYVQCDDTNNTPTVVDRNEFVASIFIKPAKSINFITLKFVATDSGVDFNVLIGGNP